jgi:hypothetical protein
MIKEFTSYPDWKAPGADSALIIWPPPAELLAQTRKNHQQLLGEESVRIQNIPLADIRAQMRKTLGLSTDRPIVATGHQTELIHPGVWAKLALIDASADKVDAQTIFLTVDTDSPKHLNLRWPRFSQPITADPRIASAEWSGLLEAPSDQQIRSLYSKLKTAAGAWPFEPLALRWLNGLPAAAKVGEGLCALLARSLQKLDESLGLRHRVVIASSLWKSEPYLLFAHHLMARAGEFAAAYNRALQEYRYANGITNQGRPMPDLQSAPGDCEVPFWIDDLSTKTRSRASVRLKGDQWALVLGNDSFLFDTKATDSAGVELLNFLCQRNARLAPRALTLTMFARMVLVDQFVHGIGGGRYDQVTDRVMSSFFGLNPPAFSVTTATLLFPTAVNFSRTCLPCLLHEGHRIKHSVMGEEKMSLVREIESFPRRSLERHQAFSKMHGQLDAEAIVHPAVKQWEGRYADALRASADEKGMFDRELFYAIQPEERLSDLITRYRDEFSAA